MPRKKRKTSATDDSVGSRIRRFRLAKGLSQVELGKSVGISQRMVTYYETEGICPPPDLLLRLAEALDVTTDELLGNADRPEASKAAPDSLRLWRRLKKLEELPAHDQNSILKMIDALAEQASRRKAS